MAVTVKSARELGLMRDSGKILAEVHAKLGEFVKPGISTLEIDQLGEKLIRGYDCVPNFLHYNGYPASICVSVNDEVVHGIPKADRILQEGDIVSLGCRTDLQRISFRCSKNLSGRKGKLRKHSF